MLVFPTVLFLQALDVRFSKLRFRHGFTSEEKRIWNRKIRNGCYVSERASSLSVWYLILKAEVQTWVLYRWRKEYGAEHLAMVDLFPKVLLL